MKAVCQVKLGLFEQPVVLMQEENDEIINIQKVPLLDLSNYFTANEEISTIELFGPYSYIQRIQKNTEKKVNNSRKLKFILH